MMRKTIFLVRHAEPLRIDAQRRYLGQSDPELSVDGIHQAQALSWALRRCTIQAVYTSDLLRAEHTAFWIAQNHHCQLEKIRELREINLGKWEGRTFQEIQAQYPEKFERRGLELENYRIPGGETFADLQKRVFPVFTKVIEKTSGNLVIVAHAGVNRVIICHLMNQSLRELFSIPQEYTAVNIIQENKGSYQVIAVNAEPIDLQEICDWIMMSFYPEPAKYLGLRRCY